METPLSGAANGLAQLIERKWFTAMGILGLLLLITTLVMEIPTDVATARCVALIMFGWGFGLTAGRTTRDRVRHLGGVRYTTQKPEWRLTFTGAIMFAIAIGAAIWLARITLL